jgi:hypothetical protein
MKASKRLLGILPCLPHKFGNRPGAVADSSKGRGNGSRLYELNVWMWMWRYGRGQPRKVNVAEAEQRRMERLTELRLRAAETLTRRREDRGGPAEMEESEDDEQTFYVIYHGIYSIIYLCDV